MQVGDLCRVTRKGTHVHCQYGQYVILLEPLSPVNKPLPEKVLYWKAHNITADKWHHYDADDLEVINENR